MPAVHQDLRRGRGFGIYAAVVGGIALVMAAFVGVYLVVDGIWWNVESQAVCTITSTSHHPVYSKSGFLGTDWDLATSHGELQVTRNGERFSDSAAQHLARSLDVGASYRLYLRGWDGWPNGAKAIIAATRQ
jgi:hypothetical protein